jgi:hypothetical protein
VFRPEPSELGPLAAPRGALYGVLGFEDPEVVCRPREQCLIKRTTGWTRARAHDAAARVLLRAGNVFSLHASRIERLTGEGWAELEPARVFDGPLDVWLTPGGEPWVVDHSSPGLLRRESGTWAAVPSPVSEPRGVFGRTAGTVYVVGANGAAELDAHGSRCVRDVPGPLHLAFAAGDSVWLAGESGAYRSVR